MATGTKPRPRARANADVVPAEWPYEFQIVELSKMFVDDSYQRPLTSFVERIKKRFDPALVGTLVLSLRKDGNHAIIDGQTRWEGMKHHELPGAPSLVFFNLTRAQEAALFAKLQKERRGIASFHRFRASLTAEEPEALAIKELVEGTGYQVGLGGQGVIPAVAALEIAYRRDPDGLERGLHIFRDAWGDRWTPGGAHVRGISHFLKAHPSVDDERLQRRLSVISPDELNRRASAAREVGGHGGGSDKYMGQAIAGAYGRLPKADS